MMGSSGAGTLTGCPTGARNSRFCAPRDDVRRRSHGDELERFFARDPLMLPIHRVLEDRILAEIDDELMAWLRKAHAFSLSKR